MDISTVVGLALGSGFILLGILLGGELGLFIDYPSLAIVGGGTVRCHAGRHCVLQRCGWDAVSSSIVWGALKRAPVWQELASPSLVSVLLQAPRPMTLQPRASWGRDWACGVEI